MDLEWDDDKRQDALVNRGLDFARFAYVDRDSLRTWPDLRGDYGETRFISYGYLDGRLHTFCWTPRGENIRIISMRKANERERKRYDEGKDPRHA